MTSIAQLRTTHLNKYLGVSDDGKELPWPADDRDQYLKDALALCWPDIGNRVTGTVSTSDASDVVTLPAGWEQGNAVISRIDLSYSTGGITRRVGKLTSWQYLDEGSILITPPLATLSGLTLRLVGSQPFAASGSDLPTRLERAIAYRAAALAFGSLAGQLANSSKQQGLDNGQIVDYPTAVGLSTYWERRYFEQIDKDPFRVSVGPRRARR